MRDPQNGDLKQACLGCRKNLYGKCLVLLKQASYAFLFAQQSRVSMVPRCVSANDSLLCSIITLDCMCQHPFAISQWCFPWPSVGPLGLQPPSSLWYGYCGAMPFLRHSFFFLLSMLGKEIGFRSRPYFELALPTGPFLGLGLRVSCHVT